MRTQMPDVSIIIALHDVKHIGHSVADQWFVTEGYKGWATCPFTQNGFARIASQPSVDNGINTPFEAMNYLRNLMQDTANVHRFWGDTVSLFDTTLFSVNASLGRKQLTDIYLLGLCQQNGGTLITLDTRMTTAAILSPHPELLRILTP